jgi:hypothetical protein
MDRHLGDRQSEHTQNFGGGDKKFLVADEPVRIDGNTVVLDVLS